MSPPATPSAQPVGEAVFRQYLAQWRLGIAATGAIAAVGAVVLVADRDAGRSVLLASLVVGVLFSASSLLLALLGRRNPDGIVLIGLGLYVLKVFVLGILLLSVPRPQWLQAVPASVAGMAAVLTWQWALISASRRSRVPLYVPARAARQGPARGEGMSPGGKQGR